MEIQLVGTIDIKCNSKIIRTHFTGLTCVLNIKYANKDIAYVDSGDVVKLALEITVIMIF